MKPTQRQIKKALEQIEKATHDARREKNKPLIFYRASKRLDHQQKYERVLTKLNQAAQLLTEVFNALP